MTEEEIEHSGILSDGPHKSKSLVFIRRLNNIDVKDDKARRFIDMDDGSVDNEAQSLISLPLFWVFLYYPSCYQVMLIILALLSQLRDEVANSVSADRMADYAVDWSENIGVSTTAHQQYLDQFCNDFKHRMIRMIEEAKIGQEKKNQASLI